jgi:hypothetical protein
MGQNHVWWLSNRRGVLPQGSDYTGPPRITATAGPEERDRRNQFYCWPAGHCHSAPAKLTGTALPVLVPMSPGGPGGAANSHSS